jgi:hypothetical protein
LAVENGAIPCTDVDKYPAAGAHIPPSEILCHWWVTPLSTLLSEHGKVKTLLISQDQFTAFNPLDSDALPADKTSSIDYSAYRASLNRSFDVHAGDNLSFVAGQSAILLLNSGFSPSEAWGTWTIGKTSRIHLCTPKTSQGDPLILTFSVAPFMAGQRKALDVSLHTATGAITVWTFNSSDAIVERSIALHEGDLSAGGCGDITLELPNDPPSPLELGISPDPRHLGIAFVGLKVSKQ